MGTNRLLLALTILLGFSMSVKAQVSTYVMTPSVGTYDSLVTAISTNVPSIQVDFGASARIPIGFNFDYDGATQDSIIAGSDGFISFNPSATGATTNDLDNTSANRRPLIAPLWDDMDGSSGYASYATTGVAPNRVFTFEWKNWEWRYNAAGPVISYQVKLFETSNEIQFHYQQESNPVAGGSASIGLTGVSDFLSLDGSGSNPGVSSVTETTSISAKPVTGQVYTFTIPSCVAVSSANSTILSTTEAILGWTENGSATSWQIEWDTAGFPQGTGTLSVTSNNPDTLTGLTPFTSYAYYVRAICGPTDTSAWVGPISFFTGYCMPAPSSVDGDGITNVSFGAVNNATGTEPNNYGDYSSLVGDIAQSTTVSVDITFETGYTYDTKIWIDWNDDLDFDDTGEEVYSGTSTSANPTTLNATFTVPANAPLGQHRMRIGGQDNGPAVPCYTGTYGSYEDYTVNVITAPACLPPSALTSTDVLTTSAVLGWTENGSATLWQIEWDTSGFTPGTGNYLLASTNPDTLMGLTAFTNYQWYVRSICGPNDTSAWVGPNSFYTGYCFPAPSSVDGDGITNVSYAAVNNTTGTEPNNYGDYSSLVGDIAQSTIVSVDITFETGYTYDTKIWIDWNDDLDFDDTGEEVYSGTSTSANPTTLNASFAVPASAPLGQHRMRIGGQDNGPAIPCYTGSYGSYEDYTVNVIAPPSCLPPSALTSSDVLSNSAIISWTENGSATLWQIEWDTAGFTQGTGNFVVSTTNPDTLMGLTANTNYQWYVRSICGPTDTSAWVGPNSFFTGYCSPAPSSVDGDGITNVTFSTVNNTTSTEPNNYGDYSALVGDIQQSSTVDVDITFETGYTYDTKIWIDWNDDLDFDDVGEEVYSGTSLSANPTTLNASFAVPAMAPLGNHRMRIGGQDSGPAVPCYTGSYGSYEDYTVNVVTPPALDLIVEAIIEPDTVACEGDSINFTVVVTNGGTTTQSNIQVTVDITGPAGGTAPGTIAGPLAFGQSDTLVIPAGVIPASGVFNLTAYTSLTGDVNNLNDTITKIVTVNATPVISIADDSFCTGDSTSLDAGAGLSSYMWSNSDITQTTYIHTAGTYYVTVTNSDGCQAIDTIAVTENVNPTVSIADAAYCAGDSVLIDAGAGYSYAWSNSAMTQTVYVSSPGTISVTITDANGCVGADTATITENPLPVIALQDTAICTGETVTLDAGSGFASYLWSNGVTSQTTVITVGGIVDVTVTDANGCMNSTSVTITENPLPVISMSDTGYCVGGTITLDAGMGFASYVWSDGTTTQTNVISSPGMPTVTVTDNNNCTNSASVTVTEYPLPVIYLNDTAYCEGSDVTLDAGAGFVSYLWSDNSTMQTLTVSSVGPIDVTVTDVNSCENSASINVTENPLPVVDLGNDTLIQNGDPITLDAGNGYTDYLWSDNSTNQTLDVTASDSVYVVVTDANGCKGGDAILITIWPVGIETGKTTQFNLYPNPNNGQFTIENGGQDSEMTIEVINVGGQVILNTTAQVAAGQQQQVDLSGIARGMYIVNVKTADQAQQFRMIVD